MGNYEKVIIDSALLDISDEKQLTVVFFRQNGQFNSSCLLHEKTQDELKKSEYLQQALMGGHDFGRPFNKLLKIWKENESR